VTLVISLFVHTGILYMPLSIVHLTIAESKWADVSEFYRNVKYWLFSDL